MQEIWDIFCLQIRDIKYMKKKINVKDVTRKKET